MSDKQFEPCPLGDATHVEVNGKMYLLGGNEVGLEYYHGKFIGIRWLKNTFIPEQLFHILGIKLWKEIKPEPIEFEATFVMYDGCWQTLHSLEDRFPDNCKKATFRCVEILEDEE